MPPAPPPHTPGLRILRSTIADPDFLARAILASDFFTHARVLKRTRRSRVLAADLPLHPGEPPAPIIAKFVALDRAKDLLSRPLGLSSPQRQYRAALLLRSRGFPTAEPLLLLRHTDSEHRVNHTIVTRRVEGDSLLRHILHPDLSPAVRQLLAHRVGLLVRGLIDANLFNRDSKPSNIIISSSDLSPVLIDPVGVRRLHLWQRSLARRRRFLARMLASLVIEPLGVGADIPTRLRVLVLRAAEPDPRARALLRGAVRQIILSHGDPTPRDPPS